jgi:hypothetical protein
MAWTHRRGVVLLFALLVGLSTEQAYSQRVVPANDHFTNSIILSGTDVLTSGTNVNATAEPGEPNPSGWAGGRSVWWTWTAPRDGSLALTTAGSGFDTVLTVFNGNSFSNLSLEAFNDNDPAGNLQSSRVILPVVAGSVYQIAVDGHFDAAGSIALRLVLGPVQPSPANDHFANRTLLSGRRVNAGGSNVYATKEPGEPRHVGTLGGKSLWWSWLAPASGGVSVSTTGSRFDTVLAVYRGESLSELVFVAGNDDVPNTTLVESTVTFNVVAGAIYQIAVDGFDSASGDVTLRILLEDEQPVPSNDNFEDARLVTGLDVTASGTNVGASFEAGEPTHAARFGGKSVWWTWTAPEAGFATIDTVGSGFDTLLGIYAGSSLANLSEIASDDDGGGNGNSAVTFTTRPGLVYWIAVDGWDSASGPIILNISFRPSPAPKLFVFTQSQAQIQTNGFILHLLAPAGFSYVLEYASLLGDWHPLQTNHVLVNGITTLQDPGAATEVQRFYRVGRLP